MFDFMDGIVEGVEQITEAVGEFAAELLIVLAKWIILMTTPVWILPYKTFRDRQRERSRKK